MHTFQSAMYITLYVIFDTNTDNKMYWDYKVLNSYILEHFLLQYSSLKTVKNQTSRCFDNKLNEQGQKYEYARECEGIKSYIYIRESIAVIKKINTPVVQILCHEIFRFYVLGLLKEQLLLYLNRAERLLNYLNQHCRLFA